MVVYLLFSGIYRVRISGMFLQWMCLRSIPGVVVSTEGAVYSTPDSQCLECYIPFIHSRHNAKDMSLGMGRDIRFGLDTVIRIMDIVYFAIKSSHGLTEHNYSVSFKGCVRLQNN